jgi:hypothetical protein
LSGFAKSQFSPDAGDYWHTTQPFTAAQLTAAFDSASFDPGGHENRGTNSAFANISIFEGTPQPGTLVASYVAPANVPSTFASISFTEIPPPPTIDASGIKVSYSPPEGGIVDGSTTHPLSGILVTDSNARSGVAIPETATVRVFYDAGEPGAGTPGPHFSFAAASPGELTNELQNLLYKATNADPGQSTQFEINVSDGFANSTYAFDVPNKSPPIVQPNPPQPGPPIPPAPPPPVTEVTQFYQNILQRSPDPGGLQYFTNAITSGALTPAAVDSVIATSPEAQTWVDPIVRMYTVLGRAPDQAGLSGWVHAYEAGDPISNIGMAFISSPEAQSKGLYGNTIPTAATSAAIDTGVVNDLYQEVLGRAADPGGQAFWVDMLQTGTMSIGTVVGAIVNSPEAINRDAGPISNFLIAAGNGNAPYGGNLFAHS